MPRSSTFPGPIVVPAPAPRPDACRAAWEAARFDPDPPRLGRDAEALLRRACTGGPIRDAANLQAWAYAVLRAGASSEAGAVGEAICYCRHGPSAILRLPADHPARQRLVQVIEEGWGTVIGAEGWDY